MQTDHSQYAELGKPVTLDNGWTYRRNGNKWERFNSSATIGRRWTAIDGWPDFLRLTDTERARLVKYWLDNQPTTH